MTALRLGLIAFLLSLPAARADEKPDLAVVHRIKLEAFRRPQVMDHLFWLTDVNGPRLTASPGYRTAADLVVERLRQWGASQPRLERWGPFGRGWTLQRFELSLVAPTYARLGGIPKAWSGVTPGPVSGTLVLAPLYPEQADREDASDLARLAARIAAFAEANRGKLRGRFVLLDPPRDLALPKGTDGLRLDDKKLGELGQVPDHVVPEPYQWPLERLPRDPKKRAALMSNLPLTVLWDFVTRRRHVNDALWKFLHEEGVAGVLVTDDRGEGGLVFAESTGAWEASQPMAPPVVTLAPEDYDRLARLVDKKVPARLELDLRAAITERDEDGLNVLGDIPGSGKHKDEVVMLGAHLDSWHAGTGATDNAVGCAVMLEAFRILRALALPMDRTVRIALWGGEEQGLRGSRAYVTEHFADPVTMKLKPEHGRLAAYFNLDNGSGKIRGVYLQGNDMVLPIFEQWLSPWRDEGATSLTIRDTGGTDHLSFDEVGLPGFQFIQDPLDYGTRTHHSNLDVYEHAQPSDLMQAAAVVASFVYQAANRAEMLPRKPLPAAPPARRQVGSRN